MSGRESYRKQAWNRLRTWFSERGWEPFEFQERAWLEHGSGKSGLVNVPTGAGKTYAAYLSSLADLIAELEEIGEVRGLRVLYVTPLRSVTRDIELALKAPIDDLALQLSVQSRTGDTSRRVRASQRKELPNVLITTPESMTLLLARDNARELYAHVHTVIMDEWHEMLGSKRGTQAELALSRVRGMRPGLRTWGLSATIENLDEAAQALVGVDNPWSIVQAELERPVVVDTLLPPEIDAFPWAGHLGMVMREKLVEAIDIDVSTLVFTNVRSQTERWYRAIIEAKPEWTPLVELHHSSLDRMERERVELLLKRGELKVVVCTSSLDLGVDFAAVEHVIQIGSPGGIARMIQRAGRSAHRPGATARITCVPTHALELLEIAALRLAVGRGDVEAKTPIDKPLDVLAQHLVTCALGGGFTPETLFEEVKSAWSYRDLSADEFSWTLDLVSRGGEMLEAYPKYHRIGAVDGRFLVQNKEVAQIHRMNIGTIDSDAHVDVVFSNNRRLGQTEEVFVSRLKTGDTFVFAGKLLEFVDMRDGKAVVKKGRKKSNVVPRWGGGQRPISDCLSVAFREVLEGLSAGEFEGPELEAARPVIAKQIELSHLPSRDELLIETCHTKEGWHLFVFPFEGRLVHEGLAAILALRLARFQPATFSLSVSDYGLELLCDEPFPYEEALSSELFDIDSIVEDTLASANLAQIARRHFREIARVAILTPQNYPGSRKGARQLQANAGLIYDVFRQYDPDNLLLVQTQREVLDKYFERARLVKMMRRLCECRIVFVHVDQPTPLGFPLIVERIRARLSTESLVTRVERLKRTLSRV